MIGIDTTVLTLILKPDADAPPDPATNQPILDVEARIQLLLETLKKNRQKIIIPTPVLSEVLVRSGAGGLNYLEFLEQASVIEVRAFDKLAAIELAIMTKQAIGSGDRKSGSDQPWQKVKLDRQIVAVCKTAGASVAK